MSELTMKIEDTSVEVSEGESAPEQPEQDGEATNLEVAEWALEELGDTLIDQLYGTLNALNEPLIAKAEEQESEAQTLRESYGSLKPRVEAQQRMLSAERDKAVAEGRDADAEARRQESAALEQNLRDILAQASACEQSAQELRGEIQANYSKVFKQTYQQIQESTVAVAIALAQLLDKVWDRVLRFEVESGLPSNGQSFVNPLHKLELTPDEKGPEAPYFISLRRWFGGRR
jgi:hypothetical protein